MNIITQQRNNNNLLFKYGIVEVALKRGIVRGRSQQQQNFPMFMIKQEGKKTSLNLALRKEHKSTVW